MRGFGVWGFGECVPEKFLKLSGHFKNRCFCRIAALFAVCKTICPLRPPFRAILAVFPLVAPLARSIQPSLAGHFVLGA